MLEGYLGQPEVLLLLPRAAVAQDAQPGHRYRHWEPEPEKGGYQGMPREAAEGCVVFCSLLCLNSSDVCFGFVIQRGISHC